MSSKLGITASTVANAIEELRRDASSFGVDLPLFLAREMRRLALLSNNRAQEQEQLGKL
jgi:hypothetical protein